MKISDILSSKGNNVITIKESAPLSLALEKLVTNKIGVLIVLNDDGGIAGILSERDVLRASFTAPDEYLENLSGAYMTSDVIFAEPDDSIDYAENMMTNNRFRHLPVIKDGKLLGLISIGDIVKAQLSESRDETKYLKDYISGTA
jgi:CBS domain-containing protein